jgi:hypothetical protein
MSGHWRICVAACFFVAGFSTWPAFSNPLTDLFNPAPKEAAAPAPAPVKEACVPQPGSATAPGQHWFYRVDGHRKCWFQAAEATHSVSKPAHHYVARRPAVAREENMAREENEADGRKKTVMDARAQLLSAATSDASQSSSLAPKAVDAVSEPDDEAAPPMPAPPVPVQPTSDRPAPERAAPRSVDVEMLLADSSLDKETAASSAPATLPGASVIPDQTATRAGMVLIALGLVFLFGSLLARRFLGPGLVQIRRS